MKSKRTRIIVIAVLAMAAFFMVVRLKSNKKQFQDDIAFSQRKIEKIPVTIEKASKGIMSENVIATGTLEAADVLNVISETQGKIVKIYKEKGDHVKAGDVLVKVDDEVIAANVLTAEANYEQFQKDVERFTRLAVENAITKRDLEQANIGLKKAKADLTTAQKALSNTAIKAPISGYINSDNVTLGQFIAGGSTICEIVNNSTLKLNIRISEKEVYRISKGQNVVVHLSVFPDKKFSGKITAITEKADASMKFNVEITLNNNAQAQLRSGLYAEAELPIKNQENLIISKRCIVGSMESPVVYVVENGKAIRRELIVGQSNDKLIEVLSGLVEGDQVIVSGQLNLKDGDDVNVVK
ncbi:MAG TPA: efflux RND transporter periplasmic adaptor subunit [Bacteroidales bacterium]|nr:efflux RND transporter periplasmic adaptor subunit [Bacteroidales bacterium]